MKRTMEVMMIGIFLFFVIAIVQANAEEQTKKDVIVETWYYKDIKALKYPQVKIRSDHPLQRKINDDFTNYIKQSEMAYQKNIRAAERDGYPADYQSDFDVKYNEDQKLSILTSNYIFSGGAHGSTEVKSFNYDLKEKKRIRLTDILTSKQQIEQVTNYVWKFASERPEIFYPDIKKEDVQIDRNTAFYFTDEGIALVFQQYEIAPYVAGNQEIEIPSEVFDKD